MLFSEPKIPQLLIRSCDPSARFRFSALQRAENSSIETGSKATTQAYIVSVLFSEPKIPQSAFRCAECENKARGFSALQRAENSSIVVVIFYSARSTMVSVLFSEPKIPQFVVALRVMLGVVVSVLFSEPKIPQS